MTLWHYTIGFHYERILAEGLIKPATAGIDPGERLIVWFSKNQIWEPTAQKGDFTKEEMHERLGGLIRIGVAPETAPYDWNAVKRLSGVSSRMANGMYWAGINHGSRPGDWRGTFDPCPWRNGSLWSAGIERPGFR